MQLFDSTIKETLNARLTLIETHFNADVVFYYGEIHPYVAKPFRDFIEPLRETHAPKSRLVMFLNTPGGSAEAVEKMVDQLLEKAHDGTLTDAELIILQNQDLALLSRYEQARDLTITLLKEWLVTYKFKDWTTHGTTVARLGERVTDQEKRDRAEEIAKALGDNKLWHSHGRMIGPTRLWNVLRLKIDDYSDDPSLKKLIRGYNDLLVEYIARSDQKHFMHSRDYF